MRYSVTVKHLREGTWYVRCVTAPNGIAETIGDTRDEALEKMRDKIRYRLEWCPCSSLAADAVRLDIQ